MQEKNVRKLWRRKEYSRLLQLADEELKRSPEDGTALLYRSRAHIALAFEEGEEGGEVFQRETALAEKDLERVLELGGKEAKTAQRGLMMLSIARKDYEKAVHYGAVTMERDLDTPANRFLYATSLFSLNPNRVGAVQALKWVEDDGLFPRSMRREVHYLKCRAYLALELYGEAEAEADWLLSHGARDAAWAKSLVAAGCGRMEEALRYLLRQQRLYPEDPELKGLEAEYCYCLDRYGEALAAAEQLIARGEDNEQVREIRVGCLCHLAATEEQLAEALAAAEQGIERCPENPVYYRLRGKCRIFAGQFDSAEQDYIRAGELLPEYDAGLDFDFAMMYLCRKKWAQAKICLMRVLEHDPSSAEAYRQLANLTLDTAASRQDVEQALNYYRSALEACGYPEPGLLYQIARLLLTLDDTAELEEFLKQIASVKPFAAERLGFLGALRQQEGDYEGAARYYRASCKKGGDYRYEAEYCAALAASTPKARQNFFRWLETMAGGGDVSCMRFAAYALAFGWNGLAVQPEAAFRLARKAAEDSPDYSCALSLLGRLYQLGLGTEQNEAAAMTYFERAYEESKKVYLSCDCATGLLADAYINGRGVARDEKRAACLVLEAENARGRLAHENVIQLYAWFALRGEAGFSLERAADHLRYAARTLPGNPSVAVMLRAVLRKLGRANEADGVCVEAVLARAADSYTRGYVENAMGQGEEEYYPAMSNQ